MVAILYDWMTFLAKWLFLMYYGFSGFGLACDCGFTIAAAVFFLRLLIGSVVWFLAFNRLALMVIGVTACS